MIFWFLLSVANEHALSTKEKVQQEQINVIFIQFKMTFYVVLKNMSHSNRFYVVVGWLKRGKDT